MYDNTRDLIDSALIDEFPQYPTMVDFGMDRANKVEVLGAYQFGLRHESFTHEELDAALGNGPMLTELVRRPSGVNGTPNPYGRNLTIVTAWDDLPEEDEDDLIDP